MTHSFTSKGNRQYRYYVCNRSQKRGRHACPVRSVPAHEIETLVAEQIRHIGREPDLVKRVAHEATKQQREMIAAHEAEERALSRESKRLHREVRAKAGSGDLAEVAQQLAEVEGRHRQVESELTDLRLALVSESEVAEALGAFDQVWDVLSPKEQAELLQSLIERIEYDGATVRLTFRTDGLKPKVMAKEEAA